MRVSWDEGIRAYTVGINSGMFYPQDSPGVPWNGLVSVTETGDSTPDSIYIDGQKVRNRVLPSTFAGTIAAFTYPDEFEPYNGLSNYVSGQPRMNFGFSYRTNNELHVVYQATVAPSNDQYVSMADTVTPVAFQWAFTTIPVAIPNGRPSAHLIVDLDTVNASALSDLEALLYGDDSNDPSLPDPITVIAVFETYATLVITDNGDGTWTASGPDSVVSMTSDTTFQIDWPSAVFTSSSTYKIFSL